MSGCLRGREVVLSIRRKKHGKATSFHVVFPAHWTKAAVLRYARSEHPEDSVRIAEWMSCGEPGDSWAQRLWLANPDGFRDFARALLEAP